MNEQLKLTPIDEIEDMADGVPVLAVEGTVKFAMDVKHSPDDAARPWSKQFFVLSSGTAEIACSMWDAEGNELSKGEKVHIENTQNKKGQWNGITKGSYTKENKETGKPERKHTLEIRANQVKITSNNAIDRNDEIKAKGDRFHEPIDDAVRTLIDNTLKKTDPDWPEAEKPKPLPVPFNTMLDSRQRAIIRQHSQSMALEVLKLKVELNELTVEDLTPSKLKTLSDYFDNDVIGAAQ